MHARTIGLIVNPVAGIGGRVGLKGSDGVVDEARKLGGSSPSQDRARRFLARLAPEVHVLTASGGMGADACGDTGRDHRVVHDVKEPTSATDTVDAALVMVAEGVDVVVFVGGDGTARDVARALGDDVPALGVPSGVKMYSGVFAHTPEAAARVLADTFDTQRVDLVDVDEDAVRAGRLALALHGAMRTPVHPDVQCGKSPGGGNVDGIAAAFADEADRAARYVLGPGTTMLAVKHALAGAGTLLGIDVVRGGAIEVEDASEADLLDVLDGDTPTWIVVSPIGEQGVVLGRGNAPISPTVLRRIGWDRVRILATPEKLAGLDALHVDTGDAAVDAAAPRFLTAWTGEGRRRLVRVVESR